MINLVQPRDRVFVHCRVVTVIKFERNSANDMLPLVVGERIVEQLCLVVLLLKFESFHALFDTRNFLRIPRQWNNINYRLII